MSFRLPRPRIPSSAEFVGPMSVAMAYYRTEYERDFYLRALRHIRDHRLVVVLGLRSGGQVSPADLPTNVRLIQTTAEHADPEQMIGWFVADPPRAVLLAMTGLRPQEGLILLFPDDWSGPSPNVLVAQARHRLAIARSTAIMESE